MRRYIGLLGLGWLLHCGPAIQDEGEMASAAVPADREAWDAVLDIGQPGLQIEIRAPYVQDRGHHSWADSGIQVEFRDPEGVLLSRLSADRMRLDYKTDRLGLGGQVVIRAGDTLEVRADSLVWERDTESLRLPDAVRVAAASGVEQGRNLQTDFDFQQWSMEAISGRWQGRVEDRAYEVEIQAQREESRRQGDHFMVRYDSAVVRFQGTTIRSPRARFDEERGVVYFSEGVSSVDSVRQFRAREVDYDLGRQRAVARGAVELREPDLQLQADELVEDRDAQRLQARGEGAVFRQGARSITARQLDYAESTQILEAAGQVVFREDERRLEAAQLTFWRAREHLEAAGGISLQVPELEGVMQSGQLSYDLEGGRVTLRDAPRLERQRAVGPLLIRAAEIHLDLEREQLVGEPEFRVATGDLELQAGRGRYSRVEEQVVLSGGAVWRQESEEGDHRTHIRADSMVVQLQEGKIVRILIPGEVEGMVRASAAQVDWIKGGGGELVLQEEQLERVELERGADLTHQHLEEESVIRVQGKSMSLFFAAGRHLHQVRVQGEAKLVSRLPEEEEEEGFSISQVRGEELEILFEDGSLAEVRVGKPEGSYYLPPKEGQRGGDGPED